MNSKFLKFLFVGILLFEVGSGRALTVLAEEPVNLLSEGEAAIEATLQERLSPWERDLPLKTEAAPVPEDLGLLTAQKALEIGLKNHIAVQVAEEEVSLALRKTKEARRALLPKLHLKWKESAGTTTGEDFEGRELTVEIQQSIYSGGQMAFSYLQAMVNLAVAKKNHEKVKEEYSFEIVQAYYNFAFAKEKLRNKLVLLGKTGGFSKIAEVQFETHTLTHPEILDVRAQLEEVREQTEEIENDLSLARMELLQLLHLPQSTLFQVETLQDPLPFELSSQSMIEVGTRHRKDYQVKKLLVLFHQYGYEAAKRKNGFQVELNASAGKSDKTFVSETLQLQDEYFVGLKVSKPLGEHVLEWNGLVQDKVPDVGQTTATQFGSSETILKFWENKGTTDVQEAQIALHRLLGELEDAKKTLSREIQAAVYSVREAGRKVENKKAALSYSLSDLRAVREKQKANQATVPQLIRSEAKMWNDKTDLVSSQADHFISVARLNKQLGVHDFVNPVSGVQPEASDKTEVHLQYHEKAERKRWLKNLFAKDPENVDFPDEMLNDMIREKQKKKASWISRLLPEDPLDKEYQDFKLYEETLEFAPAEEHVKTKKTLGVFKKKTLAFD